jgi:hypothetical protein
MGLVLNTTTLDGEGGWRWSSHTRITCKSRERTHRTLALKPIAV